MQTAAVLVLEPIFEADLQPEQYAYRPERGAFDALERTMALLKAGHGEVLDADLSGYLDSFILMLPFYNPFQGFCCRREVV